jgi:hypothetical protein
MDGRSCRRIDVFLLLDDDDKCSCGEAIRTTGFHGDRNVRDDD